MTLAAPVRITLTVNGVERTADVPPRLLLSDLLRHQLGLTGTHVGCEHGVCGACTVLVNGDAVRSCLMFAVQADGAEVRTVESLTEDDGSLGAIQAAFRDQHGLQCGFCTPGILMSFAALRDESPDRPAATRWRKHWRGTSAAAPVIATSCWPPDRFSVSRADQHRGRKACVTRRLPAPLHRRDRFSRRGRALPARGRTLRRRHRPAGAARGRLPAQPARERADRVDERRRRPRGSRRGARPHRPATSGN